LKEKRKKVTEAIFAGRNKLYQGYWKNEDKQSLNATLKEYLGDKEYQEFVSSCVNI